MKAVVAAFNQEKALVGAFSVITNLRMELFEALVSTLHNIKCFYQRPNTSVPAVLPPDYAELLNSVSPDMALDMRRVRQVGRILVMVMMLMVWKDEERCGDLATGPVLNLGHWWSLAREYGRSLVSSAAAWL